MTEIDFSKHFDTWTIAYCPDTDEFFATDQRYFFWELNNAFSTKERAIEYFEAHISYFVDIKNNILDKMIYGYKPENRVYLMNTNKWYEGLQ